MFTEIMQSVDDYAGTLNNTEETWVNRRDAAEGLGKIAVKCRAALDAHQEDADTDVRAMIAKQLAELGGESAAPAAAHKSRFTLEELAQACARPGARAVEPHNDGFLVTVKTDESRTQKVYVMPFKRRDGKALIRVYSICGEATAKTVNWVLRANGKLIHCAYATVQEDGKDLLILVNNFRFDRATPNGVKSAVKEIAFYADWLEGKLSTGDEF